MCSDKHDRRCIDIGDVGPILSEFRGMRWSIIDVLQRIQVRYG